MPPEETIKFEGMSGGIHGRRAAQAKRDARAKQAKLAINKTIPALLKGDPRARRGVESAELIVDPAPIDATHVRIGRGYKNGEETLPGADDGRNDEGLASPRVRIVLQVTDTLETACRLARHAAQGASPPSGDSTSHPPGMQSGRPSRMGLKSPPRVAILNMASPLRPGGGVLNGASSQEESICARTTLCPSLREEFYRLPEIGGVYTRDVLVFASWDDSPENGGGAAAERVKLRMLPRGDRFYIDVVTAAMLRFPDVEEREEEKGWAEQGTVTGEKATRHEYTHQKDRELTLRKMRAVLRICRLKGVDRLVLGAWGCGAYGNPVSEVAKAWRRAILGRPGGGKRAGKAGEVSDAEGWDGLEVVFAIKDARMAEKFARYFGPGMEIEEMVRSGDGGGERGSDDDKSGDESD